MSDTLDAALDRLEQTLADLAESHVRQGRELMRLLDGVGAQLTSAKREVRSLAAEQALLASRIDEVFARLLRTNIRIDGIEDRSRG